MVNIGIRPSNCVISKLHMDKDRTALIARKTSSKTDKGAKHEGDVAMAEQD